MIRAFSELTKHFSPERRERIEQRKEQLRQEITKCLDTIHLTPQMITFRGQIGDQVILDWLQLLHMAVPLTFGCRGKGVHIRQICAIWHCSQSTASRRLAAINAVKPQNILGRVECARGARGWWRVIDSAGIALPLR